MPLSSRKHDWFFVAFFSFFVFSSVFSDAFHGLDLITPNKREALELAGLTLFAGALLERLAGRGLQLTPRADAPTR